MTTQTTLRSIDDDKEYLKRMGVENEGDIAREIVVMIAEKKEDDFYAVKYGRRMIEALVNIRCYERGAICLRH